MKLAGIITVPFHVGDFISGTIHMSAEETGAYIMLLCAHYQAGQDGLPNDDKYLSRVARLSIKKWLAIRPVLESKFNVTDDFWTHSKVFDVLQKVHDKSLCQRAKALKRNNSGGATAMPRQSQPKTINHKPKTNILRGSDFAPLDEAYEAYNLMAKETGFPLAQKFTDKRKKHLAARLKDCGGMDGWMAALEKLRASKFCQGENDRGWIADFDFLIAESSFTKLMEGRYDDRKGQQKNRLADETADLLERIRASGASQSAGNFN